MKSYLPNLIGGTFALVGIIIGACMNHVLNLLQTSRQKKYDRKLLLERKMEEITSLLSDSEKIIKRIMNDTKLSDDPVKLWRNDLFEGFKYSQVFVIVRLYFPSALNEYAELEKCIDDTTVFIRDGLINRKDDFNVSEADEKIEKLIERFQSCMIALTNRCLEIYERS